MRTSTKYLLLDRRVVDEVHNARLAVGQVTKHPRNPLFGEDKRWEPRFDNLYPNVIYDEKDRLYRCWYSAFVVDVATSTTPRATYPQVAYRPVEREMGVCYAVSEDGLAWSKPYLGLVEFEVGKANNLVLRGPHGAGIFRDSHAAEPQERYKMLYEHGPMCVRFSPDGLHWGEEVPCPSIGAPGDTHNNAFWCPELGRYVGITRLWEEQRIVGRTESPNFRQWTKAVEILRGDRENQTYAMLVFPHAGVYLGFVMVFRLGPNRVHCELAWSDDTVEWRRIDAGTPLIPNSDSEGAYDWGCVFAAAYPVLLYDEIRLYYGASNNIHDNWRDAFLALATLRPDGFAAYEPVDRGRPASIVTRPMSWPGGTLRLTADAEGGSVSVGILDDQGVEIAFGEPVRSNVTDAAVTLKGGPVPALAQKSVRLRFELIGAKLYAFSLEQGTIA